MVSKSPRILLLALGLLAAVAVPARAASVTIAWDPNPEPNVRYVVFWGTQHAAYPNSSAAGTSTSFVVSNLSPGQTYYFAVQATTVDGLVSPFSDEVTTTIPSVAGPRKVPGDFSGTGKASVAVYRKSTGQWIIPDAGSLSGLTFGTSEDVPTPGDYDGDGRADAAYWHPSDGVWHILMSSEGYATDHRVQWGAAGDIPVASDYDGDGKADIAVWRPGGGVWYILRSLDAFSYSTARAIQWGSGQYSDVPVPGDYDGDGKTDLGIWRPGGGLWYIMKSSSNYTVSRAVQWGAGQLHDLPVPADYDGDGRTDIAVWRPSAGIWYLLKSINDYAYSSARAVQWGSGAVRDVPAPADYDGDGKADLVVWRPSAGLWYVLASNGDYTASTSVQLGDQSRGDVPLLAAGIGQAWYKQ